MGSILISGSKDFEKRFKYLRGSKQLKKLKIDNAGLYKKYLSNLEPKTAELALAGLRNSLIEKTIASGGDASKYYYRTMGIDEIGKSNIVREEKIGKAAKKAGKNLRGKDYDHKTKRFTSIKSNRGNRGHGTKRE